MAYNFFDKLAQLSQVIVARTTDSRNKGCHNQSKEYRE